MKSIKLSNRSLQWQLNNKDKFSDKFLDQKVKIEITKLRPSKEEIAILKLVDPTYKWIAKDKNGDVYIYKDKPMGELTVIVKNGII